MYTYFWTQYKQASFEDNLNFLDVEVEVVDVDVGQVGEEGWKDNVKRMTSNLDLD